MTKKTYQELAEDIGRILGSNEGDTVVAWMVIAAMCRAMKSDNPRFDRDRFESAIKDEMYDEKYGR